MGSDLNPPAYRFGDEEACFGPQLQQLNAKPVQQSTLDTWGKAPQDFTRSFAWTGIMTWALIVLPQALLNLAFFSFKGAAILAPRESKVFKEHLQEKSEGNTNVKILFLGREHGFSYGLPRYS